MTVIDEFTAEEKEEISKIMKKVAQYIARVFKEKGVTFTNENQKCG